MVGDITKYTNKEKIIIDKNLGVKVAFIKIANIKVELVEPLDEKKFLGSFLNKKIGIYHLAFVSNNIKTTVSDAKKNDFIQIHPPEPSKAFGNKMITWLHHDIFGLIEIIEI
ncbi:MAG: VOC family protein [Promethearchaeota archaeon]